MKDFLIIPEEKMEILKTRRFNYLRKLRNFIDVTFSIEDEIEIEGKNSFEVMHTKEIIKAFSRGFSWDDSLYLVSEEYYLEIIKISDFVGKSKNRLIQMKSRVIGTEGKSKNIIEKYTNSKIAITGKTVSIIGRWNSINIAKNAIEMILNGSKHGTVFKYLEDNKII